MCCVSTVFWLIFSDWHCCTFWSFREMCSTVFCRFIVRIWEIHRCVFSFVITELSWFGYTQFYTVVIVLLFASTNKSDFLTKVIFQVTVKCLYFQGGQLSVVHCCGWMYSVSRKIHLTFDLSLTDAQGTSLSNYYRVFHLTLTVLLHYLATVKNLK